MAYSNKFLKGKIGYNNFGWPLIIMERGRSDSPTTPIMCEVFGLEHECGSVYAGDISLTDNLIQWLEDINKRGCTLADKYFKDEILVTKKS